ncbi:hypothetical protein BB560_005226 [Smittium megazygosporum]|uniref:sn-1-specific diacylglycerol lipase n=1 Tax=Smittium megazygosporum TaxID=133381 RepID=A0A2T9Z790_9FUNG|nr:hypothetical protein BB560_005226 [Smittium megazygosporum]
MEGYIELFFDELRPLKKLPKFFIATSLGDKEIISPVYKGNNAKLNGKATFALCNKNNTKILTVEIYKHGIIFPDKILGVAKIDLSTFEHEPRKYSMWMRISGIVEDLSPPVDIEDSDNDNTDGVGIRILVSYNPVMNYPATPKQSFPVTQAYFNSDSSQTKDKIHKDIKERKIIQRMCKRYKKYDNICSNSSPVDSNHPFDEGIFYKSEFNKKSTPSIPDPYVADTTSKNIIVYDTVLSDITGINSLAESDLQGNKKAASFEEVLKIQLTIQSCTECTSSENDQSYKTYSRTTSSSKKNHFMHANGSIDRNTNTSYTNPTFKGRGSSVDILNSEEQEYLDVIKKIKNKDEDAKLYEDYPLYKAIFKIVMQISGFLVSLRLGFIETAKALIVLYKYHNSEYYKRYLDKSREKVSLNTLEMGKHFSFLSAMAYTSYSTPENPKQKDNEEIAKNVQKALDINPEFLLGYSFYDKEVYIPSYYVIYHKQFGSIVLAIRGTENMDDLLSDLTSTAVSWENGYCHEGIKNMTNWLFINVIPSILVFAKKNSIKNVVFTGHSLGGSIASMLMVVMAKYNDDIKKAGITLDDIKFSGYGFGSAPAVSKNIMLWFNNEMKKQSISSTDIPRFEFCSFINQNDAIPSLSFGAALDINEMLIPLMYLPGRNYYIAQERSSFSDKSSEFTGILYSILKQIKGQDKEISASNLIDQSTKNSQTNTQSIKGTNSFTIDSEGDKKHTSHINSAMEGTASETKSNSYSDTTPENTESTQPNESINVYEISSESLGILEFNKKMFQDHYMTNYTSNINKALDLAKQSKSK